MQGVVGFIPQTDTVCPLSKRTCGREKGLTKYLLDEQNKKFEALDKNRVVQYPAGDFFDDSTKSSAHGKIQCKKEPDIHDLTVGVFAFLH